MEKLLTLQQVCDRDIVKCCGIKILQRILIPRILPKQHPLSQ